MNNPLNGPIFILFIYSGSDIPKRMPLFLEPCIGVKNCEKRRQNHRYHPKPQSSDETFFTISR